MVRPPPGNYGVTGSRPEPGRPLRWSRTVLLVDGALLIGIGLFASGAAIQSYVDGSGPFSTVVQDQPYVVGFVESGLLIAVIGAGLLAASRRPHPRWHGWAVLAHGTLIAIDLGFLDTLGSIGVPTTVVIALALLHAVSIAAHGWRIAVLWGTAARATSVLE